MKLRIIDLRLNPRRQRHIPPLLPLIPHLFRQLRHAVAARTLHHLARHHHARVAHPLDLRVDQPHRDLLAVEAARERRRRRVHHVVRHAADLGEDGAEAEAGEDVAVGCQ